MPQRDCAGRPKGCQTWGQDSQSRQRRNWLSHQRQLFTFASKAVAMGYVLLSYAVNEQKVFVKTDRGELTGNITETPFYKGATGRNNLANYL